MKTTEGEYVNHQHLNHSTGYVNQLTTGLYSLQQRELLCDVTLTADNGKLAAHSAVLAAVSDFICQQFKKLTDTRSEFNIHLPGCDLSTLEVVLRLLYTGNVELRDWSQLCGVMEVCTSLGVNVQSLHNVSITIVETQLPVTHTQLMQQVSEAERPSNDVHVATDENVSSNVVWRPRETFVVIEQQQNIQQLPAVESLSYSSGHLEYSSAVTKSTPLCSSSSHEYSLGVSNPTTPLSCSSKHHEYSSHVSNPTPLSSSSKQHEYSSAVSLSSSPSRHRCDQCGKLYRSARYLRIHRLSHGGLKPLLCDTCGRGFYGRVNLNRHVLLRHQGDGGASVLPYVCDRCGKGFVAAARLRRHLEDIHADMKRHRCDTCQLTFANAGNLQRHRQLHSAEPRPFKCELCQRRFTQRSSLQAHQRLHDSEARCRAMCVCHVCGKVLSKSTNLRKHLRHHTPPP